jgi:TP901 family phage tail tape measure protein
MANETEERVVVLRMVAVADPKDTEAIDKIDDKLEALHSKAKAFGVEAAKSFKKMSDASAKSATAAQKATAKANISAQKQKTLGQQTAAAQRAVEQAYAGTKGELKDLIAEAAKLKILKTEAREAVRDEVTRQRAVAKTTGAYKRLGLELVLERQKFKDMAAAGKANARELKQQEILVGKLDGRIKQIDASAGQFGRNVGNYPTFLSRIMGPASQQLQGLGVQLGQANNRISSYFGAIGVAAAGGGVLSAMSKANYEISDALSDVRKQVDGSDEDFARLLNTLKQYDSRTNLAELLGIGELGGRQGVDIKTLGGFVQAIDKINVALGKDLGGAEGTTNAITGLRNTLTDTQTGDIASDLLRIGNAVNVLDQSSTAAAPDIINLAQRMGGLNDSANVSAASTLGLSAAMDDLQIAPEAGATAFNRLLSTVGKAPETFGQFVAAAGLVKDAGQFYEEFEQDAVKASLKVAAAINQTGDSNIGLIQKLDELGFKSVRTQETILKLGTSYEKASFQIGLAEAALQNQDSLLKEFNEKNNNYAAQVDKLGRVVNEAFVQPEVQSFLGTMVQGVTMLVSVLAEAFGIVSRNPGLILTLAAAITVFGNASAVAAGTTNALTLATIRQSIATRIAKTQQWLLNAAMYANPVGLVVVALLALTTGLYAAYQNSERFREIVNDLWSGIQELAVGFKEAYDESLLLKAIFFQITAPISLITRLFNEGPEGARLWAIGIKNFAQDSFGEIQNLKDKALKVFLEFQKGLAFTDRANAGFTAAINKLDERVSAREKKRAERTANLARLEELNKVRLEQERIRKQQERLAAEEKEKLEKAVEAEKKRGKAVVVVRRATNDQLKALAKSEDTVLAEAARAEIARRKKVADEAIKAAKARFEAARKIIDLENELIKNDYDRQVAQAKEAAKRAGLDAKGDPAQVARQRDLINQQLNVQLAGFEKARVAAVEAARKEIDSIITDTKRLRTAAGVSLVQAANAEFDRETKLLINGLKEEQRKALQGSSEVGLGEDGVDTARAKALRDEAINIEFGQRELQLLRDREAQKSAIEQEALTAGRLVADQKFAEELLRIENEANQRTAKLQELRDQGKITPEEFATANTQGNELRLEQIKSAEAAEAEAKMSAFNNYVDARTEAAEMLAKKERDIRALTLREDLDNAKARGKIYEDLAQGFGETFGMMLDGQVSSVEDVLSQMILLFLDATEKFVLLEATKATASSLAQADSVATFGATGLARAALITGLIKGAFAAIKSQVRSSLSAEEGVALAGNHTGLDSGLIVGDRHSDPSGGVDLVPGVKAEGGEWLLRNGHESYVITREAVKRSRRVLEAMSGSPNIYSSTRGRIASTINTRAGGASLFGRRARRVMAEQGASLVSPSPNRISRPPSLASDLPSRIAGGVSVSKSDPYLASLEKVAKSAIELAMAANGRIDRLQVVNDPVDTQNKANEFNEELRVDNQV